MTEWTSLSYVVVDVEGNGQHPPGVVELAVVPIVGGIVGDPRSWLVRPEAPITPIARRLHGITDEQVKGAPTFASVEADVREALSAPALIAHNAHVDVGVLRRKLGNWNCPEVIDTLTVARRLLPGRASYKLGSLVEEFDLSSNLDGSLQPHRATYDALVTARLFVLIAGARTLADLRGQPSGGAENGVPTLF